MMRIGGQKRTVFGAVALSLLLGLAGCLKHGSGDGQQAVVDTPFVRPAQQQYSGQVLQVSDGDSLRLRDEYGRERRIRLAFVDAPETDQAHGQASAQTLRDKLVGKRVAVAVLERDQYKRDVGAVSLEGEDIGLWLLGRGMVWHYQSIARRQQDPAAFERYQTAESTARAQRQGLWQERQPQPPWAYRRDRRH